MNHGLELLRGEGLPICNRLFREVHSVLLGSGRGSEKTPGRFRREQNWIGGSRPSIARYVPPPWEEVEPAMRIKAALAHALFESIHPFLDGNGRIGRLLITLLLVVDGVLKDRLLYLSLYLKQNRDDYYDHLQRIRSEGAG